MTTDRRTRAQLAEALEAAQKQLLVAEGRAKQVSDGDPEATAIRVCAEALKPLMHDNERGRTARYGSYLSASYQYELPGPVARVLDYLRVRCGLPDPAVEAVALRRE